MYRALYYGKIETQTYNIYIYIYIYIYIHTHTNSLLNIFKSYITLDKIIITDLKFIILKRKSSPGAKRFNFNVF